MKPIPDHLEKVLNSKQLMTLRTLENHGWELCFVRRDGLEVSVPVIKNEKNKTIGIIGKNGNFIENPNIKIRINPESRGPS